MLEELGARRAPLVENHEVGTLPSQTRDGFGGSLTGGWRVAETPPRVGRPGFGGSRAGEIARTFRREREWTAQRAALAAIAGGAYLAALLALDRFASYPQQLLLGVLTIAVFLAALSLVPAARRLQALGVLCFATIGEATGSLLWGVYHYRLHNLPLFVPPAHGLVFLTGLALAVALRRHSRALVVVAATAAAAWGVLGLSVLPTGDVAGAIGVPLLLAFLWRSRNRAIYAGVFLVVAALELYGTALGTWQWAPELPGLGIPDGNPPSGVASGYVWFDVMALCVFAPAVRRVAERLRGTPVGVPADRRSRRARRLVARDRDRRAPRAALVEIAQHERHEVPASPAALALPHHPLVRARVADEARERIVVADCPHGR